MVKFLIDMDKPITLRSYTVCVKSERGCNAKTISLYTKVLNIDDIKNIIYLMIYEEYDKYIDIEKRYCYDVSMIKKKRYTHRAQIFEFDEMDKCIRSTSIGFKESLYSANEIADIIEIWFKKRLREEKKLDFPDGKVKNFLRGKINA